MKHACQIISLFLVLPPSLLHFPFRATAKVKAIAVATDACYFLAHGASRTSLLMDPLVYPFGPRSRHFSITGLLANVPLAVWPCLWPCYVTAAVRIATLVVKFGGSFA